MRNQQPLRGPVTCQLQCNAIDARALLLTHVFEPDYTRRLLNFMAQVDVENGDDENGNMRGFNVI